MFAISYFPDVHFKEGSRTTSIYTLDYPKYKQHATETPEGLVFKHLPHIVPGNQRRQLVQTSTSSAEANARGTENTSRVVEKKMIMPSKSGFTVDIDHTKKGNYPNRFLSNEQPKAPRRWDEYRIISMGSDSFSRSPEVFMKGVVKSEVSIEKGKLAPLQDVIKMGKKEKTGSVIENPATIVFTAPNLNYDTEQFMEYTAPAPLRKADEFEVKQIDRSGYSLNNRFQTNSKVIDEVFFFLILSFCA
jgi:hypothetical protein